jgi:creatinine amidohydrolase
VTVEVRAERLSPDEIEARLAERSVVYLPLGTLEFHGPHLPVGLDALTGHGVCTAAALRSGGVVLPTVFQGFGGGHVDYPWTVMMSSGEAITANLLDTLVRLEALHVGTAVLFSGHFAPEQLDLIGAVASVWQEDGTHAMRVVATSVDRCPTASIAPDHAGVFETTLLSAIEPDLVHLDRLPDPATHPAVDPGGDPAGAQRHDPANPLWGVFGPDPRGADLGAGPLLLAHLAAWLASQAE